MHQAFPSDEISSAEGRPVKEGELGDVKWSSTQVCGGNLDRLTA